MAEFTDVHWISKEFALSESKPLNDVEHSSATFDKHRDLTALPNQTKMTEFTGQEDLQDHLQLPDPGVSKCFKTSTHFLHKNSAMGLFVWGDTESELRP